MTIMTFALTIGAQGQTEIVDTAQFVADYPTYLYASPAQEGGVHETIECFVEGTKSWQ